MDSIPQELVNAIIDNVPQSSLPSCSLVVKRWQQKSQRRLLGTIAFLSEGEVKRWCTDNPQDSDGISSYVRHVKIEDIYSWAEPALLGRMLGSLGSLTALSMYEVDIPDELPGHISRGEFGKGIITLDLHIPYCEFATLTSIILSLPNLKELHVKHCVATPGGLLPAYSVTPQRGPLDTLELLGHVEEIIEALAKSRLTSRHLSLDVGIANMEQLLLLSLEIVVELTLCDASTNRIPPLIPLPPLPALTTLVIDLRFYYPLPHLTNTLCSIDSAPALSSIAIKHTDWERMGHLCLGDQWVDVDRWLSRMAKQNKVTGGLSLTLGRWPKGKPVWEGFLPEFRESAGQIKVDNSM